MSGQSRQHSPRYPLLKQLDYLLAETIRRIKEADEDDFGDVMGPLRQATLIATQLGWTFGSAVPFGYVLCERAEPGEPECEGIQSNGIVKRNSDYLLDRNPKLSRVASVEIGDPLGGCNTWFNLWGTEVSDDPRKPRSRQVRLGDPAKDKPQAIKLLRRWLRHVKQLMRADSLRGASSEGAGAAPDESGASPRGMRTPKGNRGRREEADPKADKRVADAWGTGHHRTYAECGRALGMTDKEVRWALDRHRKRPPGKRM